MTAKRFGFDRKSETKLRSFRRDGIRVLPWCGVNNIYKKVKIT